MIIHNIPEFLSDAFFDSVKLVPFLFLIFIFIELFETKYSKKIINLMQYSRRFGPIAGALIAVIPQCGFSVIASTLFVKRFISAGTLIAVYIATSDEALPLLITDFNPLLLWHFISSKLILAILTGYLVDIFFKVGTVEPAKDNIIIDDKGCCNHEIIEKKFLLYHPIKHTINIFLFIFITCVILNYIFMRFDYETLKQSLVLGSVYSPVFMSLIGLIPNCSISILIVMLFLENTISFGSLISGLSTNAGLGLLVLIKNNKDKKQTAILITILLISGIIAGIILNAA